MARMSAISVTPLHDPVHLVHIPLSTAHDIYATKLYWTVQRAAAESEEFFNLTSNRIEIALFAETELVNDEWGSVHDPSVRINGPWRVFELSSGDDVDGAHYDSPHLREVSAPLAEIGVSILYQSSYFTDFLFVKSEDYDKAASIFAAKGWYVDALAPLAPRRRSIIASGLPAPWATPAATPPPPPLVAEITVLSSPLACVGLSRDAEFRTSESLLRFLVWPERTVLSLRRNSGDDDDSFVDMTPTPTRSVTASDSRSRSRSRSRGPSARPFVSYTRTEEGLSLLTEVRILRSLLSPEDGAELLQGELDCLSEGTDWHTDDENATPEEEDTEPSSPLRSPTKPSHSLTSTPIDAFGPPSTIPIHWASTSTSSPSAAGTPTSATGASGWPVTRLGALTQIYSPAPTPNPDSPPSTQAFHGHLRTQSDHRAQKAPRPQLRRASEHALPRLERTWGQHVAPPSPTPPDERRMRCLQLDLRAVSGPAEGGAYHLDKSGLVTRFSNLLHSGGVRMLYSSTMHTANILVEGGDVWRAERLLREYADIDVHFCSPCSTLLTPVLT